MNLNKSLACLLSASTFISSMPNSEAADNKFKKVFDTITNSKKVFNIITSSKTVLGTIINSEKTLCTIGASGLAAIIGGGVLIARNGKAKKVNSKSATYGCATQQVKFYPRNSQKEEWPQGAGKVLCTFHADGCPNAISVLLPDPTKPATASFLLQGLRCNKLKEKLEELLTENAGNPNAGRVDLNIKYAMSLEPSNNDNAELRQFTLDEYIKALDQTHKSSAVAPEPAVTTNSGVAAEQPEQPEDEGSGDTHSNLHPEQLEPVPEAVPQATTAEDSNGNAGHPKQPVDAVIDSMQPVPEVSAPAAADESSEGAAEQPVEPEEQHEAANELADKSYNALCDALQVADDDMNGEDEAERMRKVQKNLKSIILSESTDTDDEESPLNGKTFHIVTITGVTSCKYVMYETKKNEEYYVLPFPEHRNSTGKETFKLSSEDHRKIYELANKIGNQPLSPNVVTQQPGVSLHSLKFNNDKVHNKSLLKQIPCSLIFNGKCNRNCYDGGYKGDILGFYKTKIKQQFFPNLNDDQLSRASVRFYQLSDDSKNIVAFDVKKMCAEHVGKKESVYKLPCSQKKELHLLITTESALNQFLDGENVTFNGPTYCLSYPTNVSNEDTFLEMMISRNLENQCSPEYIDGKFKNPTEITTIKKYNNKRQEFIKKKEEEERKRREQQEEEERKRKEQEEKRRRREAFRQRQKNCTKADIMKNITGFFTEDPPGTKSESDSAEIMQQSFVSPPPSSKGAAKGTLVEKRKKIFLNEASKAKNQLPVYLKGATECLDRLVVSPNIVLANLEAAKTVLDPNNFYENKALVVRGKYLRDKVTSEEVCEKLLKVVHEEGKVDFCRLGTFLVNIGQHLKGELGVNIKELHFDVVDPSELSGEQYSMEKGNMDNPNSLICKVTEDYLRNHLYDDWKNEKFKENFVKNAQKVFNTRKKLK